MLSSPLLFSSFTLLFLLLLSGTNSQQQQQYKVEASSLQSDNFKECFCFNSNTDTWCYGSDWAFFNVASCRSWLMMNLAWMIAIFIVSNIFFFATCFCCYGAASSSCYCCAPSSISKENTKKYRWYFTGAFALVIGSITGMMLTSGHWADTTSDAIDSAKALLFQTVDLLENNAKSIKLIGDYPSQGFSYSSSPQFVTSGQYNEAKVDLTAVSDTISTINDVFPIVRRLTTNHSYGRPAWVTYACSVAFLTILFIFIAMLCNKHRYWIGVPGGLFSLSSYWICGYLVSVSISLSVVTEDVCAVYDDTFVPVLKDAAKVADACDRDYAMNAAAGSLTSFASFVYDNRNSVAPSHSPCSDIRLLDSSAVPQQGCVDKYPDTTTLSNNYTSYSLPNISSFGTAYNNTRVTTLLPSGKKVTIEECTNLQPSTDISSDQSDACKRLYTFYTNAFTPISYIGYTAAPDTQNCHLFTSTLKGSMKHLLCDEFYPSVKNFAIAGGCYLFVALFTLITIRWGCHHFRCPDFDSNGGAGGAINSTYLYNPLPGQQNHQNFSARQSDLESMNSYKQGKGVAGPPMDNYHYASNTPQQQQYSPVYEEYES